MKIWTSQCGNNETVRDGAERFVAEFFGAERKIRWLEGVGMFRFADGYWCYRIGCECAWWVVERTERKTPKAKYREKGRTQ